MMNILITGGSGQLATEIAKQLKNNSKYNITSATKQMLDITNLEHVKGFVKKYDIVINCAAYTAVDRCEEDIENAYQVNALGPKHLAIVCNAIGAKLIHISTDYVFSGQDTTPRQEDDIVDPQTIYGKSKLLGEEHVRIFCKKHFIVRTGWLYGEGNNFVRTMLKLAQANEEIYVVADQYGSPTWTKDLAAVILRLMATEHYGTYHGTCEGECSWFDFACKIFQLANIDIPVNQVTSEEFITRAKRPKYSVLDNFNLKRYGLNTFRHWEEALQEYLREEYTYDKI